MDARIDSPDVNPAATFCSSLEDEFVDVLVDLRKACDEDACLFKGVDVTRSGLLELEVAWAARVFVVDGWEAIIELGKLFFFT